MLSFFMFVFSLVFVIPFGVELTVIEQAANVRWDNSLGLVVAMAGCVMAVIRPLIRMGR